MNNTQPITLLLCALGGEGGGVLTEWLVATARRDGPDFLFLANTHPETQRSEGEAAELLGRPYELDVAGWTFEEALVVIGRFTVMKGVLEGAVNPSLASVVEHIRKAAPW